MTKTLLSTEEMADLLQVHPQTVRKWALEKRIPSVPAGSRRRYDADAVIAALKQKGDESDNSD